MRLRRAAATLALALSIMSCSGPPASDQSPLQAADEGAAGLARQVNAASAPALAALISVSRDQALQDGARPIPPEFRKRLRPYFDEELLDQVRWTTSGARPGIDTLLAGFLEYDGAVTLDRVIVFFNDAAAADESLWVHELHHVEQYRSRGVARFAQAYVSGWRGMERRAQARSTQVMARLDQAARSAEARKTVRASAPQGTG